MVDHLPPWRGERERTFLSYREQNGKAEEFVQRCLPTAPPVAVDDFLMFLRGTRGPALSIFGGTDAVPDPFPILNTHGLPDASEYLCYIHMRPIDGEDSTIVYIKVASLPQIRYVDFYLLLLVRDGLEWTVSDSHWCGST